MHFHLIPIWEFGSMLTLQANMWKLFPQLAENMLQLD